MCAAKFVAPTKSETLVAKLCTLASIRQAKALEHYLYVRREKSVSETIYYSVEIFHQAITNRKQVTFQYYEYTHEKRRY